MTLSNELIDRLLADYKKPEDLIGENVLAPLSRVFKPSALPKMRALWQNRYERFGTARKKGKLSKQNEAQTLDLSQSLDALNAAVVLLSLLQHPGRLLQMP